MGKKLIEAKKGTYVQILNIIAGVKAHNFLADLGIHEGEKIRVIKNDSGPLILEVKKTRVAIGRGLAEKIIVKTIEE